MVPTLKVKCNGGHFWVYSIKTNKQQNRFLKVSVCKTGEKKKMTSGDRIEQIAVTVWKAKSNVSSKCHLVYVLFVCFIIIAADCMYLYTHIHINRYKILHIDTR